jgi:hypothetical protein
MSQPETLRKLIALEPIEPLHAQFVCGWPADEFQRAMKAVLAQGWARLVSGGNQHTTRLEAA